MLLFWFGVDVSKLSLHVAFADLKGKCHSREFKNNAQGVSKLLSWCKGFVSEGRLAFCMEATGDYHLLLALFLSEEGHHVSVMNPSWIKHFGMAKGRLNKNDKADARLICDYGRAECPADWEYANPTKRKLFRLYRRRNQLTELISAEMCRRECPAAIGPDCMESIKKTLKLLRAEKRAIEAQLKEMVESDEILKHRYELLSTLGPFALASFLAIMAEMPEIGDCADARSFAAAAGGNPVSRQSGTSLNGSSCNRGGRKRVRSALWMVILGLLNAMPELRALYDRLRARAKKHKQAMLACVRKLLMICYGIIKNDQPYRPATVAKRGDPQLNAA